MEALREIVGLVVVLVCDGAGRIPSTNLGGVFEGPLAGEAR